MTPQHPQTGVALPQRRTVAIAVLALLLPVAATAQTTSAGAPDALTLSRYDKNGNGRLDPDEVAAMQADQAKASAAVTTAPAASGEDVVKMSPFEVSGAGDRGYYAANTLSGTRMNSKLEDLGASITVVTKQQMEDFALLDINDVFLYEAGTEGTGNFTDFTIDRNGNVADNVAGDPNNANRIRGITSANQARDNFVMSGRVPTDPIDTGGIEISRGPNSSIFGLGNASGTVNVIPADASLARSFTTAQFRIDSFGSPRASLDVNRPLIANKLAVRASAVYQLQEFDRKPSLVRSHRYNGMVTYRPFSETTIQARIRYYDEFARRPNSILPRDGITYWEASGMPSWNAFTSTLTRNGVSTVVPYNNNQGTETTALGAGVESGGSGLYARPSIFINPDGSLGYWIVGRQSSTDPTTGIPTPDRQATNDRLIESAPWPRVGPLWQTVPSLTDKSRYDWTSINLAAPNWQRSRDTNYTVKLEQFFFRTPRNLLGVQLGWNREENFRYNRNFIGQSSSSPMIVYIDVNQVLPDGTTNPYFGKPYLSALEPTASRQPWYSDQFRVQLGYQLTLSHETNWLKWLGDHTFSTYGEYRNTRSASYGYRDAIVDPHAWLPAGSIRANGVTAARGYYRYYVGDATGGNIDSAPPDWSTLSGTYGFHWYDTAQQKWITENATIGEGYVGGTRWNRNVVKTQGGVTQNHFLEDRIVTTFGLRRDESYTRNSDPARVAYDGLTPDLQWGRVWSENWLERDGRTKTAGVVVKPLRHWKWLDNAADRGGFAGFFADSARSLSLFYNRADSFLPSTFAHNLVGEMLPDPSGKDKEFGGMLTFFHDKLVIRYNHYVTVQANSRAGDSGTIASRASRIDFSATTGGSDNFNLYRNEIGWVTAAHPTFTPDQIAQEVANQMQLPVDFLAQQNEYPISDTSDVTAKGNELEVSFNPTKYFRSKLNVTEEKSVDNHLSPAIMEYINMRYPVWQQIKDPTTNTPWWTTKYRGTSPEDFYLGSVLAPYKLAVANEGKTKSQIREWRVNALGTLQLAALTDNRWVSRVSVSGAVRWESAASIGYYTLASDPNTYDPNGAIYDKPHAYFDAGLSYKQKLYDDRIQMRVQLNGRNITEGGRLQPIGALPNGQPHSYRIIDPRQIILTVTFDL